MSYFCIFRGFPLVELTVFCLNKPSMHKKTPILRNHKAWARRPIVRYVFFAGVLWATITGLQASNFPIVNLLTQFRPIGGTGNNLKHPKLDVPPGAPEINLSPLSFAPGTHGGLVNSPNPRTISNVISGGTGANGQNGQTTDPTASAWLYVFGQFVDHDLDLEATPLTNPAINITIPPGDPVFPAGTSIQMNRCTRSPATNTIINTVAGYLDLS